MCCAIKWVSAHNNWWPGINKCGPPYNNLWPPVIIWKPPDNLGIISENKLLNASQYIITGGLELITNCRPPCDNLWPPVVFWRPPVINLRVVSENNSPDNNRETAAYALVLSRHRLFAAIIQSYNIKSRKIITISNHQLADQNILEVIELWYQNWHHHSLA